MSGKPITPEAYLDSLPDDRREAIEAVRAVVLKNLPEGYAEGVQYGMLGYFVPHEIYPAGYHCNPKEPVPFLSIASQKNHMALYMFCLYTNVEDMASFVEDWEKSGKKLDMGKSCVRFKKLDDVPLAAIGRAVRRVPVKKFLESYEAGLSERASRSSRKKTSKKAAGTSGKASSKKTSKRAGKKTTKKKPAR